MGTLGLGKKFKKNVEKSFKIDETRAVWREYIWGKTTKMVKTFKLRAYNGEPHVTCKGIRYDGKNYQEVLDFAKKEGDLTRIRAEVITNRMCTGEWLMHFRPYAFVVKGEGDLQAEWEEIEQGPRRYCQIGQDEFVMAVKYTGENYKELEEFAIAGGNAVAPVGGPGGFVKVRDSAEGRGNGTLYAGNSYLVKREGDGIWAVLDADYFEHSYALEPDGEKSWIKAGAYEKKCVPETKVPQGEYKVDLNVSKEQEEKLNELRKLQNAKIEQKAMIPEIATKCEGEITVWEGVWDQRHPDARGVEVPWGEWRNVADVMEFDRDWMSFHAMREFRGSNPETVFYVIMYGPVGGVREVVDQKRFKEKFEIERKTFVSRNKENPAYVDVSVVHSGPHLESKVAGEVSADKEWMPENRKRNLIPAGFGKRMEMYDMDKAERELKVLQNGSMLEHPNTTGSIDLTDEWSSFNQFAGDKESPGNSHRPEKIEKDSWFRQLPRYVMKGKSDFIIEIEGSKHPEFGEGCHARRVYPDGDRGDWFFVAWDRLKVIYEPVPPHHLNADAPALTDPWFKFLEARKEMIHAFYAEDKSFNEITQLLNLDENQAERIYKATQK